MIPKPLRNEHGWAAFIAPALAAIGGGSAAAGGVAAAGAAAAVGSTAASIYSAATAKTPKQTAVIPPPNPQTAQDIAGQARQKSVAGLGYQSTLLSGANYSSTGMKTKLGG